MGKSWRDLLDEARSRLYPDRDRERRSFDEGIFSQHDLSYEYGRDPFAKAKKKHGSKYDPLKNKPDDDGTWGSNPKWGGNTLKQSDDYEKWKKGTPYKAPEKWTSAGCVVIHGLSGIEPNYVYVITPSNNYGPVSFPKGKVDPGESKENTALREVLEEAGIKAKLLPNGYLGSFEGGYSVTHFYMAVRVGGSTLKHDKEVEEVRAVTIEEAKALFTRTGNKRDGAVADAAAKYIAGLKAKMGGKK